MPRRRILCIEDDAAIRRGVVDALGFDGYDVLEAESFASGLSLALRAELDLVLLDLVLPKGSGLDLLAELRLARPTLPVIIVTAKAHEEDRVRGLTLGADDYVVKPFSLKELLARVRAVLRRSAERPLVVARARFDGGTVELADRRVRFDDGRTRELSELETELCRYLAQNAARTVTRAELLERIWRLPPNAVRTRTIDMHVARLREKLGDDGADPRVVLTVRGKGYRFAGGTLE